MADSSWILPGKCSVLLHILMPAEEEKRKIWYEAMKHPVHGIRAFTCTQPGYLELEVAEDAPREDGKIEMFIWERWESKESYNAYLVKRTPDDGLMVAMKESGCELLALKIMDKTDPYRLI